MTYEEALAAYVEAKDAADAAGTCCHDCPYKAALAKLEAALAAYEEANATVWL